MTMFLRCTPPATTAQQKGVAITGGGKLRFYTKPKMAAEIATWRQLLQEYVPPTPLDGALTLAVRCVYPYPASWPKKKLHCLWPKTTKPDCSNWVKAIEDQLTRMRFVVDDARFSRVTAEKWYGPADKVGIEIAIEVAGPW